MFSTTQPDNAYTIDALTNEGFSVRSIRYYRSMGLLPPPLGGRGKAAYYTDLHLSILRQIKQAKDDTATLGDLKERFRTSYAHAFKREQA